MITVLFIYFNSVLMMHFLNKLTNRINKNEMVPKMIIIFGTEIKLIKAVEVSAPLGKRIDCIVTIPPLILPNRLLGIRACRLLFHAIINKAKDAFCSIPIKTTIK
ncbi:hypothetical protein AP20H10_12720 [Apilactobacillus apinorum]|uniref:Uncharacterized protein n=1 Tax=Apilactobacillus apinorum TaxID=1218495 RepID=A0ABP9ZJC0_9LACO